MSAQVALHQLLASSASSFPERAAIEEPGLQVPGHCVTYRELAAISDRVRDRLRVVGVVPRDRVGVYLRKSIDAVASILGILKAGAAYVPVDPGAPSSRNAFVLNNCSVKAVLLERRYEASFRSELEKVGPVPPLLLLDGTGGGLPLSRMLDREDEREPVPAAPSARTGDDDLAYILYTSGSTGRPKGVMLSHRNALSFVDWCSETFQPSPADRFSSHAPLHFDLSILDLYVPLKHGATLVLVSEEVGKDPARLAPLIAERRLSIWYSAPSILSLLVQHGQLQRYDYSALRMVLFAGEVFPVKHLRTLRAAIPHPRYFNLYGPTETNVCTFQEIPAIIPEDRTEPFPIGRSCSHLRTRVVDPSGRDAPAGEEGELCVAGPGVMQGYWNLPEQNARAFLEHPAGSRWYRTGDIVVDEGNGTYRFLGRRDRMVKRRGYRVELGEIESALYRHPAVKEVAVIAIPDEETGIRVKAFLSFREGKRPSLIELKRFCSEALPLYMVPDFFACLESLPKTSTDKIDYQGLRGLQ